jgi:hypothetical protein
MAVLFALLVASLGAENTTFSAAGHGSPVTYARFTGGGAFLIAADQGGSFKLWKTDGTLARSFRRDERCNGVDVSPDGRLIAVSSMDHSTAVTTFPGGNAVCRVPGFDPRFLADGRAFATRVGMTVVTVWDLAGKALRSFHPGMGIERWAVNEAATLCAIVPSKGETSKAWISSGSNADAAVCDTWVPAAISKSAFAKLAALQAEYDREGGADWAHYYRLDAKTGMCVFSGTDSDRDTIKRLQYRIFGIGQEGPGIDIAFRADTLFLATWERLLAFSKDGTLVDAHRLSVQTQNHAFSPDGSVFVCADTRQTDLEGMSRFSLLDLETMKETGTSPVHVAEDFSRIAAAFQGERIALFGMFTGGIQFLGRDGMPKASIPSGFPSDGYFMVDPASGDFIQAGAFAFVFRDRGGQARMTIPRSRDKSHYEWFERERIIAITDQGGKEPTFYSITGRKLDGRPPNLSLFPLAGGLAVEAVSKGFVVYDGTGRATRTIPFPEGVKPGKMTDVNGFRSKGSLVLYDEGISLPDRMKAVFDPKTGKVIATNGFLEVLPDGSAVFLSEGESGIALYDGRLGKRETLESGRITASAAAPDGSFTAFGTERGAILMVSKDGAVTTKPKAHMQAIRGMDIAGSGASMAIATAGEDAVVRLWRGDGAPVETALPEGCWPGTVFLGENWIYVENGNRGRGIVLDRGGRVIARDAVPLCVYERPTGRFVLPEGDGSFSVLDADKGAGK